MRPSEIELNEFSSDEAARAVARIVGTDLLKPENLDRLKATLADLVEDQLAWSLLIAVAETGELGRLADPDSDPLVVSYCVTNLVERRGLREDLARWAVELWFIGSGELATDRASMTISQSDDGVADKTELESAAKPQGHPGVTGQAVDDISITEWLLFRRSENVKAVTETYDILLRKIDQADDLLYRMTKRLERSKEALDESEDVVLSAREYLSDEVNRSRDPYTSEARKLSGQIESVMEEMDRARELIERIIEMAGDEFPSASDVAVLTGHAEDRVVWIARKLGLDPGNLSPHEVEQVIHGFRLLE